MKMKSRGELKIGRRKNSRKKENLICPFKKWKNRKKKSDQKQKDPMVIQEDPQVTPQTKKMTPENSDLARGDGAWESRESELQADAH